jgi:hypothetical protein
MVNTILNSELFPSQSSRLVSHVTTSIETSSPRSLIDANTIAGTLNEIRNDHVIPVFVKDNEPAISHADFLDTMVDVVKDVYHGEHILQPVIRLSHPIKGRIPTAKDKPANQLQDWEKTVYYERMMFAIEIPSICDDVNGNRLSLTVGGVKAFNLDNLYQRKGADEHFKIFVGFQNKVCTNLCVWTDGYMSDLKVKNLGQLKACIQTMLQGYNASYHMFHLQQLPGYSLTEQQFAHFIGRCRMYQYLSSKQREGIAPLTFGDLQIGTVCRDYYKDNSFAKDDNGDINLWNVYNLFTGANKNTYIDQFLDRSVNAFNLAQELKQALEGNHYSWYLN